MGGGARGRGGILNVQEDRWAKGAWQVYEGGPKEHGWVMRVGQGSMGGRRPRKHGRGMRVGQRIMGGV